MELICIVCPNGCHLTVDRTPEGLVVSGNKCIRGEQYGKDEMTDPRRVVTAVARTTDPGHPCIPVKSDRGVPRAQINAVLRKIYACRIDLPVTRGAVCLENCCGTGVSILFTRSLSPSTPEPQP
jgi:CxxC motif-containing protein